MKDTIITVPLTSGMETKINLVGGSHAIITNRSDSVVYVSKYPSIVADSNGVKAIEGGSADILRDVAAHSIKDNTSDWYGTIYALSDSDSKIQIETTNNSNFKQVVRGGDYASTSLDSTLKSNATYQLGILTSDITLTLPETATSDIEVDFAIADTTYTINCDYLSLDVVANTYYQVLFSYDKTLETWFSSVVSSDYTPVSTLSEVEINETN